VTWLSVLVGGAVGAVLRHVIAARVQLHSKGTFPVGILVVNLTGAFALGLVSGADHASGVPAWVFTTLQAGLLGAYTTYSTWAVDSLRLLERRQLAAAAVNLAAALAAGVVLVALGRLLGAWLVP
jgi:fluoride exporter